MDLTKNRYSSQYRHENATDLESKQFYAKLPGKQFGPHKFSEAKWEVLNVASQIDAQAKSIVNQSLGFGQSLKEIKGDQGLKSKLSKLKSEFDALKVVDKGGSVVFKPHLSDYELSEFISYL